MSKQINYKNIGSFRKCLFRKITLVSVYVSDWNKLLKFVPALLAT